MATVPTSSISYLAEEQAAVRASLDRLARRIRLALWVRYASYGVLVGSILSILAVLAFRAGWLTWPLVPVVAGVYVVALIMATVVAFRSKIPLISVALLADDRQGLKQRLSSSLALSDDPESFSSPFFRLQMVDAASVAPALDARKVFPLKLRWEAIAAAASVALTALVIALVLRSMGIGLVNGVGPSIVAQTGTKLANDAKRIANEADAQKLPETKQYADKMAKLARQMQSHKMAASEALKQISNLSAQVRKQQEQLAHQSAANANAKNNTQAASNKPTSQKPTANDERSLSQVLRQMADQIGSHPLSPSEQQRTAQALKNLTNQSRGAGLPQTAKYIDAASKALAQGKQGQAASELKQAAKTADIEEQQAMQKASQQAQSQAGQQGQNKQGSGSQNPQSANQAGQRSTGQQGQGQQGQKGQSGHNGQSGQKGQGQQAQGQKGNGQSGQSGKSMQAGQQPQSGQQSQAGQQSQSANQGQQGQSPDNGQQAQGNEQSGSQASSGQQGKGADAQGMQSIEQSLQQAQQQLSGQSGSDSPNSSNNGQGNRQNPGQGSGQSQKPGSGQQRMGQGGFNAMGQQGGQSQGQNGAPSNVTAGDGKGSPTAPGKYTPSPISGTGYKTPKTNMGVWRGKPQQIDNYDPSRNSRYAKVYLPTSSPNGQSITRNDPGPPGSGPAKGQTSTVPYYQVYPQFKKSAEAALGKEDIPRAYEKKVRQYFQSLTPPSTR